MTVAETRVDRNLLIPLNDGVTLAGDLYAPDSHQPGPALLNYLPYRKDDIIGSAYYHANQFLAGHGYRSLIVDLRGLGNSGGVAHDAFDGLEARDAAEIIGWMAQQPWCDGNIGMWGMSYPAVVTLQTAALRPPNLKAIVPIMGTADVYEDWLYPGGCGNLLGAMGAWGTSILALQLMPPMYQDCEGRWERVWRERLESAHPYVLPWQDHPEKDAYWVSKMASVEEIEIPAFCIGGWRDLFPEGVPDTYQRLRGPRKLLMGPWMHTMPDAAPFEAVEYLDEVLRWYDHWLRGADNGIMDEPPVTFFVQGSGKWRNEEDWPVKHSERREYFLDSGRKLSIQPPSDLQIIPHTGDPTVGVAAGLWDPQALGVGLPLDQGEDEAGSVVFTTDPLPEDLEIVGATEALVQACLEEGDEVNLVAKLSDVSPDDQSRLITTGWLRGAHRDTHEEVSLIELGEVYSFRVRLWSTAYRVPQGNRLRLSIATDDFPRIWPTSKNPRLRVVLGGREPSAVALPIAPAGCVSRHQPRPADGSVNRAPLLMERCPVWRIERDLVRRGVTVTTGERALLSTPDGQGRVELRHHVVANVVSARPDGASVVGESVVHLSTPRGEKVMVEVCSWITRTALVLDARVSVDGRPLYEKRWQKLTRR